MKKSLRTLINSLMIGVCLNAYASTPSVIKFATSAEYPPFEYKVGGKIVGFDIDLANMIAKELGKEAVFEDMQFSTILPALQSNHVDAAIATITVTPERKQHFDFSQIYYLDAIAVVYKKHQTIQSKADLKNKKIACQLGSTMQIWLKSNGLTGQTMTLDNNNLAIEALKANHVDVVIMDGPQGALFSQNNPQLTYTIIDKSADGYAIAAPKGSPIINKINQAISNLKQKGELSKLEQKWLSGAKL